MVLSLYVPVQSYDQKSKMNTLKLKPKSNKMATMMYIGSYIGIIRIFNSHFFFKFRIFV